MISGVIISILYGLSRKNLLEFLIRRILDMSWKLVRLDV